MKYFKCILLISLFIGIGNAKAQYSLPPIDLGIPNIIQETPVWCWAAVAQQIILSEKGPRQTPPQCELVTMAKGFYPSACCGTPLRPPYRACFTGGSLQQIQGLIAYFGGKYSVLKPPTSPHDIYRNLSSGRAIIMAVQTTPYSGHVVVIRGMRWDFGRNGLEPVLLINDPMSFFSQPVPYENIAYYWRSAIVVS